AGSSINSLTTMRPYHERNNIIVGANCIRPLLITAAAHLYVRESYQYEMQPFHLEDLFGNEKML
ncbi:MAG: hypothetical protein ACKO90_27990, partial [Microcystis panniformis]